MTTNEGFRYRPGHGLERGMKCQAAITPLRNIPAKVSDVFDVIVLGAGYAGLTACRDLCTAGEPNLTSLPATPPLLTKGFLRCRLQGPPS